MLRKVASFLMIAAASAAAAQQQAKPSRTISYFTKNDPKYGELLAALQDEPKCATVEVNVYGDATNVDAAHETWWLLPSPKPGTRASGWPMAGIRALSAAALEPN